MREKWRNKRERKGESAVRIVALLIEKDKEQKRKGEKNESEREK